MHPRRTLAVVAALAVGVLSSCSSDDPAATPVAATRPAAAPATFALAAPKGGVQADLTKTPLDVSVTGGVIDDVSVLRPDGSALSDRPDADGHAGVVTTVNATRRRVSGLLAPATAYRVLVRGHNGDGVKASRTFPVTTARAELTQARMLPGDDDVVGVGMPVRVQFSEPVPDRAAAQRHLKIKTTPAVTGSWGWLDDSTAVFRPKGFWPAGTRVSAAFDGAGASLGEGAFGGQARTIRFRVGRDLRMSVSNASHTLTITQSGKRVRVLPVSLGRPGHSTRSGTKIVYSKHTSYTMRGDASDPYVTTVAHAQRITDSGEFLHAAPWSVGAQGRTNVSHGCTNLSPSAASWLFGRTLMGDPVITTGTSKRMETWDGLGGVWNYTWPQWQKQSAL